MVKPSHLWLMESTLLFVIAHPGSSRPAHKSGRPLHEISERFINRFIKYRVVRQNLNPEMQVQILMEHTVSSGFEPDNSTFPGQTLIIQSVPTVFANLQV